MPAYCQHCGQAHPWTAERIRRGVEVAGLLDELTAAEREAFERDLPSLIQETPESPVAVFRTRRILARVKGEGGMLLRQVLADIASATIRGQLGLP